MRRRVPRWSDLQPLLRPERIPLNPTERRLGRAHTIHDLRKIAARRVPRAVFDYTDGAAGRRDQPAAFARAHSAGWSSTSRAARRLARRDLADDARAALRQCLLPSRQRGSPG